MAKTIKATLIVNIDDNDEITAGVKLDFNKKKFSSVRDLYYLQYLKESMRQHAELILNSTARLAGLREEIIERGIGEIPEDEYFEA